MKAVAYLRISGKGQLEGSGLDRQRETIQDWASANDYDIECWYEEVYSGSEADRPVFTAMLVDLLDNGIRTIVIESSDRLARDVMVSQQLTGLLIQKGLTLFSASADLNITDAMAGDPMMKAIAQMQAVFAELDKNILVSRLRKGREKVLREKGRCGGPPPFGEYDDEREAMVTIRKLRGIGPWKLANYLNKMAVPTRTGAKWTTTLCSTILKRLETEDARLGSCESGDGEMPGRASSI